MNGVKSPFLIQKTVRIGAELSFSAIITVSILIVVDRGIVVLGIVWLYHIHTRSRESLFTVPCL